MGIVVYQGVDWRRLPCRKSCFVWGYTSEFPCPVSLGIREWHEGPYSLRFLLWMVRNLAGQVHDLLFSDDSDAVFAHRGAVGSDDALNRGSNDPPSPPSTNPLMSCVPKGSWGEESLLLGEHQNLFRVASNVSNASNRSNLSTEDEAPLPRDLNILCAAECAAAAAAPGSTLPGTSQMSLDSRSSEDELGVGEGVPPDAGRSVEDTTAPSISALSKELHCRLEREKDRERNEENVGMTAQTVGHAGNLHHERTMCDGDVDVEGALLTGADRSLVSRAMSVASACSDNDAGSTKGASCLGPEGDGDAEQQLCAGRISIDLSSDEPPTLSSGAEPDCKQSLDMLGLVKGDAEADACRRMLIAEAHNKEYGRKCLNGGEDDSALGRESDHVRTIGAPSSTVTSHMVRGIAIAMNPKDGLTAAQPPPHKSLRRSLEIDKDCVESSESLRRRVTYKTTMCAEGDEHAMINQGPELGMGSGASFTSSMVAADEHEEVC